MDSTTFGEDVSNNLLGFALDPEDMRKVLADLPSTGGPDREAIEYELRFLRLFAVDYGITLGLGGNTEASRAARNWFSIGLDALAADFPQDKGPQFLAILRDRVGAYIGVSKRLSGEDPFSVIGQTFARFCGSAEDEQLSLFGRRIFLSTAGGVAEYVKSVSAKLGREQEES